MEIKKRIISFYDACDKKFEEQFEFKIRDVSYAKLAAYMYKPKDAASLAVTRMLFGLAMLFDVSEERGGSEMDKRWGDPKICHFPLLPCVQALPMPFMALVYAALWLGALGIMLGYKYRATSSTFAICYWYLFLVEKSYWNNHTYLFGLVALLLSCTDANCYWSLDAYLDPAKKKDTVPYWNYFILKYQFFILYFMAGLKKGTAEWLSGYSLQGLSEHWVFAPFKLFLSVPQTDYLVVHWFIFAFDLTIAGWMMWSRSRHLAMVFCALFHLMNSRLFRIGMFPWVCLATMPVFYPPDWPKLATKFVKEKMSAISNSVFDYIKKCIVNESKCKCMSEKVDGKDFTNEEQNELDFNEDDEVFLAEEKSNDINDNFLCNNNSADPNATEHSLDTSIKQENGPTYSCFTINLIIIFVFLQAFLPYSHFITKGYNNWTNGLYGYSWDMMVHTWEPHSIIIKVVDNHKNAEFYVDPELFTPNDRWSIHGDMVYQFAHCLKDKIIDSRKGKNVPANLSIYIDVWSGMNGRFVQRMFDPKVDMLKASWSPFEPTHYLVPMLDEALTWRQTLEELKAHVYSWNEQSDVTFFAEFPGYDQEKFMPAEFSNITLTVLAGQVAFEPEVTQLYNGQSYKLVTRDHISIASGKFHRVINIGDTVALYYYTYYDSSEVDVASKLEAKLPVGSELRGRLANMVTFVGLVARGVIKSIFMLFDCQ